jgi:hypothetical protein
MRERKFTYYVVIGFSLPCEILENYRLFPSEGRKGKTPRISLLRERENFEFFPE